MPPWLLETIGYVASVLVAASLTMSSVLRLRVLNLAGSATFTLYGLLIQAYPVAAVNAFIVGVNVFYLRRMLGAREYFRLLETRPDADYVRHFLAFHREDIARFLPDVDLEAARADLALFVLRDTVPAGLLLGRVEHDTLHLYLDYVTPPYRDFKVGRFLFREQADFFRARGIGHVVSPPGTRAHEAYLRRMGFRPEGEGADRRYRLNLAASAPAAVPS